MSRNNDPTAGLDLHSLGNCLLQILNFPYGPRSSKEIDEVAECVGRLRSLLPAHPEHDALNVQVVSLDRPAPLKACLPPGPLPTILLGLARGIDKLLPGDERLKKWFRVAFEHEGTAFGVEREKSAAGAKNLYRTSRRHCFQLLGMTAEVLIAKEPVKSEIFLLGDRQCRVGSAAPVTVTEGEYQVLQAFVSRPTMDQSTLRDKSGWPDAPRRLKKLCEKYDGVFRGAIRMPGGKGRGGYYANVIDLQKPGGGGNHVRTAE